MNQWLRYITRQAHVAARHATIAYVACVQQMFDMFGQCKSKTRTQTEYKPKPSNASASKSNQDPYQCNLIFSSRKAYPRNSPSSLSCPTTCQDYEILRSYSPHK